MWIKVKDFFKKQLFKIDVLYQQINDFYFKFHAAIKVILFAAFMFGVMHFLNYQRNFYLNQEVFDLNNVPSGYVVWLYPKDKSQEALLPDSLKIQLNVIDPNQINYNVNVWVIGIYTSQNQIVKIEVPDYAISQFKLGAKFHNHSKD